VKWFQPKPSSSVPQQPVNYPSDVVVETESGYWYIKGKSKLRIFSDRSLDSWQVDTLPGSDASVSKFKQVGVLGFRNGTLVRNIADGRYYLISENKRRHIVSPDVFEYYGFDMAYAMSVSQAEIDIHDEGEVLS